MYNSLLKSHRFNGLSLLNEQSHMEFEQLRDIDHVNSQTVMKQELQKKHIQISILGTRLEAAEAVARKHAHCDGVIRMLVEEVESVGQRCEARLSQMSSQNARVVQRLQRKLAFLESRLALHDTLDRTICSLNVKLSLALGREKVLKDRIQSLFSEIGTAMENGQRARVDSAEIDCIDVLMGQLEDAKSSIRGKDDIIHQLNRQIVKRDKHIEALEKHRTKFEEHYNLTKSKLDGQVRQLKEEMRQLENERKLDRASGNTGFTVGFDRRGKASVHDVRTVERPCFRPETDVKQSEKRKASTSEDDKENGFPLKRSLTSVVAVEPSSRSHSPDHTRSNDTRQATARRLKEFERAKQIILQDAKLPPRMRCAYATEHDGGLLKYFDEQTIRNADPSELLEMLNKYQASQ